MAGDDSGRKIVRTEIDPHGSTGESTIYVCADGSRWVRTTDTAPCTARPIARIVDNKMVDE